VKGIRVYIGIAACVLGATAAMGLEAPADGVPFDGKSAYQVAAEKLSPSPTALTVSAWVKVESVGEPQVFLNRGLANDLFTFYLYKDGVRMLVSYAGGQYAHANAPAPEPGVWTHYAGSYDGTSIKVYRNGKLVSSTKAPGQIAKSKAPLVIGALDHRQRFLNGGLADVRVWHRTLTDAEVARVAAGKALDKGLASRWTESGLAGETWTSQGPAAVAAARFDMKGLIMNAKDDGYRGIWYYNQKSNDEYVYKYSGGLGTYCAKHIPHAWYVKEVDKTFFTWGGAYKDKNRLLHMVSYYDHKTGMVPRPTILLDKETDDAHDNPVINVDDDGYIWIFSSSHGTGRPSYISRSKEPYNIDEFELKWTGNFSYPQPWFIPGKGWLFMHTHYTGGRSICMMTSPDAVNWSERRFLSRIDQGHYQISRPCGGKVGTAFNYHPKETGLNWRTNLYYMESDDFGETWKNVQGETLSVMLDTVDNPALVHEYESEKLNVYMKDIAFDSKGHPIILYVTSKGYESGPENMPRTWTTARWTGSEWDIQGGDVISDNNYDTGLIYLESDDIWRIIGPTETGPQPYNPGGEVAIWMSKDQGKNWTMTRRMTENSPYNHTYVRRPINAHPDFCGFWADGHGRQPSESRLYFCNKDGDAFRLPMEMTEDFARPERIN
jgi:Concanavalin A-like lectin/glucanases superfamily/BNR repeat-containing family member